MRHLRISGTGTVAPSVFGEPGIFFDNNVLLSDYVKGEKSLYTLQLEMKKIYLKIE